MEVWAQSHSLRPPSFLLSALLLARRETVGSEPAEEGLSNQAARRVLVVGLTGGIASGKSTVAGMLRELGAVVLDADQAAREVVRPGEPALAELVRHFGPEVLAADGGLDRGRLAERVFGKETELDAVNAITHPRIGAYLEREIARLDGEATAPTVVVVEAAVMLEAQWELEVDTGVGVLVEQWVET